MVIVVIHRSTTNYTKISSFKQYTIFFFKSHSFCRIRAQLSCTVCTSLAKGRSQSTRLRKGLLTHEPLPRLYAGLAGVRSMRAFNWGLVSSLAGSHSHPLSCGLFQHGSLVLKARKTVCLEVTIFRDSAGGRIRRSSQTGQLLPVARADSQAVTPVRLRALVCFAPSPLPRWLWNSGRKSPKSPFPFSFFSSSIVQPMICFRTEGFGLFFSIFNNFILNQILTLEICLWNIKYIFQFE